MNINKLTKQITLDWDNLSDREVKRRVGILSWYIHEELNNKIESIFWRKSPSGKGWHIKINMIKPVPEALTRFNMGDDARRILLDIFRPKDINNINWDIKKGKRANKWTRIS